MELRIGRRAQRQIRHAAKRYDDEEPGLGSRFEAELDRVFRLLGGVPRLGAPIEEGLRAVVLRRFPFSVVYALRETSLDVVGVVHHKRHPGAWREDPA